MQKENIFNVANNITFVRIILSFVALALVMSGNIELLLVAIILIAYSELTDMLDGYLARRDNCVTSLGKLLDPLSDSISRFIYFFAFGYMGLFPIWLVIVLFVRDIIVAYIRTYMSLMGIAMGARWSGKAKALVQFGGQYLLLFMLLVLLMNQGQSYSENYLLVMTAIGTLSTFAILHFLKVKGNYYWYSLLGYVAFLIPFYSINKFDITLNTDYSTAVMVVVALVTLWSLVDYLSALFQAMKGEAA
ncbi:MAG: CDP-alcohol phosphatidyltransferase family protein [Campylobacterales bacterium]|nr:CDP-alcohol phosphatidyltransferase family protein [Campylobacterales bacterium]